MIRALTVSLVMLASCQALAQQQPDPAFLQRALAALQQQRNVAMDAHAASEANRAGLSDEVARLKARIAELEKPAPDPKASEP